MADVYDVTNKFGTRRITTGDGDEDGANATRWATTWDDGDGVWYLFAKKEIPWTPCDSEAAAVLWVAEGVKQ